MTESAAFTYHRTPAFGAFESTADSHLIDVSSGFS